MPEASQELWSRLGGAGACAGSDLLRRPPRERWGLLPAAAPTRRGESLFPRIDKKAYFKEMTMETTPPAPAPQGAPSKPEPAAAAAATDEISIQDFQKVRLRTGKVLAADRIEGADRLLKLTVDVGTDTRTVVAGIAQHYAPESLVGKTVVIVANLKPAKLRGVESKGMLLAADLDGVPVVATFEKEIPPGNVVR